MRFALFDFSPVGLAIALLGLAFLTLLGWRLIPRSRAPIQAFEGVDEYVAELHLPEDSELIGQRLADAASGLEKRDVALLGVVRKDHWTPGFSAWTTLAAGDVLVVEGAPEALAKLQG